MLKELWLGLGVESNIKVSLKEIESIGVEWNRLGQCKVLWRTLSKSVMNFRVQ